MVTRTASVNTVSSEPGEWTAASLNKLKVAQLKELCKEHSVSATGKKKAELVECLLRLQEDNKDEVLRQKWSSVNLYNLKKFCASGGLATNGTRAVLISRLIQNGTDPSGGGDDIDNDSDPDLGEKKEKRFSLRLAGVSKHADRVWDYRGGIDLYTELSRGKVVKPHVDHILEVQVLERAMENTKKVSGRTRNWHRGLEDVKKVVNDVVNLNMTNCKLNKMKGQVFTAWLKNSDCNLQDHATDNGIARGHWPNIEKALLRANDDVLNALHNQADQFPQNAQVVEAYGASLNDMIDKMKLG
jgi:hypothetical protein